VPCRLCFGQLPRQLPGPPLHQPPSSEDEERAKIEKDMEKKANQERQAQLKRDANELLKLATELKLSVDKSNENILALDVIKKADEIERLARSVKEKMRAN
jgi:hypothetical protein